MPADKPDIRQLQTAMGLTQQQFALVIGLSPATVTRWLAGKPYKPDPLARDILLALAHFHITNGNAATRALGVRLAETLAVRGQLRSLALLLSQITELP